MYAKKTIILFIIALLLLSTGCVKPFSLHVCDFKDDNISNYPDNLESYIQYRRAEYIEMEECGGDVWAPIVPRIIPETNKYTIVKECYFCCDRYRFILDDLCQCYIVFAFDSKELFDLEENRISGLVFNDGQKAQYNTTVFTLPAYIVTLEHFGGASEYMLIDRENLTMYYIHYDGFDRDELMIPDSFLPLNDSIITDFSVVYTH